MSIEQLMNRGWHVELERFSLLTNNGAVKDQSTIITNCLNTDIKEYGAPILASELKQNKTSQIILQIQKIRNISAPRVKEESQAAPRMLKVTLTDGHTYCQAVEVVNLPSLSRTGTSPGSKLLLNGAKVISGCLLISPQCCTLLGGIVPAMYEKWQLMKNITNELRISAGTDGPPKWVNFGQKIVTSESENRAFKALKEQTDSENPNEFDLMRKDAISTAAATGAVRKVFGGGVKNTELNLKVKDRTPRENPRNSSRVKREPKEKQTEKLQKQPEKISLFDFLENKLEESGVKPVQKTSIDNNSFHVPEKRYPQKSNSHFKGQNTYYTQKWDSKPVQDLSNNFANMSLGNDRNFSHSNRKERTANNSDAWQWKVGDNCMAKYWEDNKFYNAQITNLTESTCVVRFSGYGNVEEVLKTDCIPITSPDQETQITSKKYPDRGAQEFRKHRTFSNNRYSNRNATTPS